MATLLRSNSDVTEHESASARRAALASLACCVLLLAHSPTSRAQPKQVLRFASVAPEGSAWARSYRSFARRVERGTKGEVGVQLYLGAVAGDEREMRQRAEKGQLDGVLSGGIVCVDAMPTLRVTRIPGVFQSREEAMYVVSELGSTLASEALRSGFVLLGTAGVGPSVILARAPVRDMSELRSLRLWRLRDDDVAIAADRAMGLQVEPMSLEAGAKAFDEKRIDGFYAAPTAAHVYQWHTQVSYVVDLWGDFQVGCFLVTADAYDQLTPEQQQVLREAGVELSLRFEETSRRQDDALLGGIFARYGVELLPVNVQLRAQFFEAARAARRKAGNELAPETLLNRVLRLLADYRAEHGGVP